MELDDISEEEIAGPAMGNTVPQEFWQEMKRRCRLKGLYNAEEYVRLCEAIEVFVNTLECDEPIIVEKPSCDS